MKKKVQTLFDNAKFELGSLVATPGATDVFNPLQLLVCLGRHSIGDWGEICDEDKQINEYALKYGERLFSCYQLSEGKLYIITERDRSVTTLLLPDEY